MGATIILTERLGTVCSLSTADAAFLCAQHRGHLQVAPAGPPGHYRLTPRGYVGVIQGPSCRLVIKPKIPLKNLCYLLAPATPVRVAEDETTLAPDMELLDLLVLHLANLMQERAQAGLACGYVEQAVCGPVVHGRLDLAQQLRRSAGLHHPLHSRYDELTVNVLCNQIPKGLAECLYTSPLLGVVARQALAQALARFALVIPALPTPEQFAQLAAQRPPAAYQPLLALCRLLADGLGPALFSQGGPQGACPAFLLNLERTFEEYGTQALQTWAAQQSEPQNILVQPRYCLRWQTGPAPATPQEWHLQPDLVLLAASRPPTVVDFKWKRRSQVHSDLYQVLAYCTALNCPRGALVYPSRRNRWQHLELAGGVRLRLLSLRVVGPRSACEAARGWLVHQLTAAW